MPRIPDRFDVEQVEHLAKMTCGHVVPFVKPPVVGWWEWCTKCGDFQHVTDGVSI